MVNDSALDVQVGGDHYKNVAIQPIEYCHKNGLGPCESAIVKYVTRWRSKGGLEDLKKIKHYVDLLIELEGLRDEGEGEEGPSCPHCAADWDGKHEKGCPWSKTA